MSLFDDARRIIEGITKDCPKTGESLTDALEGLEDASCAGTGAGKDDAFGAAYKAVDGAYNVCPDHKADLDALKALIDAGRNVKCGGGG